MGANSTGQTPNQRINDQVSSLLDNARRQVSIPAAPRMEELANWDGNPADGQTAVYSKATGLWGPGTTPIVFDFPGPLAIVVSDLFCPAAGIGFSKIQFSLRSTGSTATQVGIYLTGALAGTATIPASTALYVYPITLALSAGVDTLQLRISQVGTGTAGLVAAAA